MLNRVGNAEQLIRLCLEQIALVIAWHVTIYLRLALNPVMGRTLTASQLYSAAPPLVAIVLLWLVSILWLRRGVRKREAFPKVGEAVIVAATVAIVVTFFFRETGADLSRSFVLLYAPTSFVALLATHRTFSWIMSKLGAWAPLERVAVVGDGPEALSVMNYLKASSHFGLHVAGIILPHDKSPDEMWPTPVLGSADELGAVINRAHLNRIVFTENCLSSSKLGKCSVISKKMGVSAARAITTGLADDDSPPGFGLELLEMRPVLFTRRQEALKAILDLTIALGLLLLLAPLLVLVAVLVKATSPGPVYYCALRVGRGGKHFWFYKFRTMYCGREDRGALAKHNEKNGHLFKVKNDPRVTPIGRILRRYSLDELPQLFNVLLGEMSLVGPRPLPAQDLDPDGQSTTFRAWGEQRSRVLPGITGLWQVSGRSELMFEQMVALDTEYIRNWSLWLDVRILLKTPLAVLTGGGAY